MFNNLKLRNRMLLGYSVPILLFVGLAIPVVTSVNKAAEAFKQTQVSIDAVEGGTQMAVGMAKMARDVRGYIALNKDEGFLRDYQSDLQYVRERAEVVGKVVKNTEQSERLKKMLALVQEYDDFANQMVSLVDGGKQAEAAKILRARKGVEIIKEFEQVNTELNKKERELLQAAIGRAESNLNFLLIAVGVGTVVGIFGALVAAFLISSGIARKIAQAVAAIASSSNEIATTVEQQERTASQQASSVNETTTTMDELGASSQQSAEQAEAAEKAARQALNLAEGGTQAVGQTLSGMSELKARVGAIAEEIVKLSEQTSQIGSISNLVSDLANQTNMLALNAAVEAVRAGEHGKGFGVVASEIRKLADQSKKSAEKINGLVGDIQNAINSTVMVTDQGTRTVDEGMEIAQKTSFAFSGVADAVNNVVLNNQQISLNIKQQAIAIGQVVTAMNTLNQGATEAAAGISQTKLGTNKLNEAAQELKAVV
jgi:methyl-accepting chemotaxis protein